MTTALPEKIPEEQPGVGEAVRVLVAAHPDLAGALSKSLEKLCANEGRGWSRRLHLAHSGYRWPEGTEPLHSEIMAIEMAADRGGMCLSAGEDAKHPLRSFRLFQMADVRAAAVLEKLRAALDDHRVECGGSGTGRFVTQIGVVAGPTHRRGGVDFQRAASLWRVVSKLNQNAAVPGPDIYKGLGKTAQFLQRYRNPAGRETCSEFLSPCAGPEGSRAVHYTRESVRKWLASYFSLSVEEMDARVRDALREGPPE